MTAAALKETPLADIHRQLGARMVDFAGWNMPVQYKSIVGEHMAVRTKVGLFDVSHMGEFIVSGNGAHKFLQYVIANDLNRLNQANRALYTQLVRPDGGTVDDLIVYRRDSDYLLVVNASNIQKDWNWLQSHLQEYKDVSMKDISDATSLLALQGPQAVNLMSQLTEGAAGEMPSFSYLSATVSGININLGRTGYTGEDGFEIFVDANKVRELWLLLLERGKEFSIEPCGLGARDTLRLESSLPLYGHELTDTLSPLQAGLGWSVKLEKENFLGREVMAKQKQNLGQQIVCLKAEGKALPRQGYPVYSGNEKIGEVTSGSQGIFVGYPIAFALVSTAHAKIGEQLSIGIRDSKVDASVVARPFYKRKV